MNTASHTELYLLRHGETQWNLEKRFQGHQDSPLTENGRKQALQLAEILSSVHFDLLISSDLGRAIETAKILNEVLHIPGFSTDSLLRERNFGQFHGLTRQEAERKYPKLAKYIWTGSASQIVPGGESRTDVHRRAVAFLDKVKTSWNGKRILVVTHGGIVNAIVRDVLQIPLDAERRFKLPNTALNVFSCEQDTWFLKSLGIVIHLGNGTAYDETI
jgi:2,3-bisphosphoglycerate-dependent phosphoglycerate mutase